MMDMISSVQNPSCVVPLFWLVANGSPSSWIVIIPHTCIILLVDSIITYNDQPTTLGRPVNARFMKRFSHRHSVRLCIFYHVYEGFVVLVLGGASAPFFHGTQALSFSIWNAWPGWIPIWFFRSLRYSAKAVTRGINPGFSKRRLAANCCTWALRGLILPSSLMRRIWPFTRLISDSVELSPPLCININIAMRCASLVTRMLSSHPTPPHPST